MTYFAEQPPRFLQGVFGPLGRLVRRDSQLGGFSRAQGIFVEVRLVKEQAVHAQLVKENIGFKAFGMRHIAKLGFPFFHLLFHAFHHGSFGRFRDRLVFLQQILEILQHLVEVVDTLLVNTGLLRRRQWQ